MAQNLSLRLDWIQIILLPQPPVMMRLQMSPLITQEKEAKLGCRGINQELIASL